MSNERSFTVTHYTGTGRMNRSSSRSILWISASNTNERSFTVTHYTGTRRMNRSLSRSTLWLYANNTNDSMYILTHWHSDDPTDTYAWLNFTRSLVCHLLLWLLLANWHCAFIGVHCSVQVSIYSVNSLIYIFPYFNNFNLRHRVPTELKTQVSVIMKRLMNFLASGHCLKNWKQKTEKSYWAKYTGLTAGRHCIAVFLLN